MDWYQFLIIGILGALGITWGVSWKGKGKPWFQYVLGILLLVLFSGSLWWTYSTSGIATKIENNEAVLGLPPLPTSGLPMNLFFIFFFISMLCFIVIFFPYVNKFIHKKRVLSNDALNRKYWLAGVVSGELFLMIWFWDHISLLFENHEWLKGVAYLLFAAVPAYLVWHWRDQNKLKDQEHTERDLKLKEANDAWDNFRKYQEIVESKVASDAQKTSAVFALGEYYKRQGTKFPRMVHAFLKLVLEEYWNSINEFQEYQGFQEELNKTYYEEKQELLGKSNEVNLRFKDFLRNHKLPEYIKAVHEVIKDIANDLDMRDQEGKNVFCDKHKNYLDLSGFILIKVIWNNIYLRGAHLMKADLGGADLGGADLNRATLIEANLHGANLYDANLSDAWLMKADLRSANLEKAKLINASLTEADLGSAKLMRAKLMGAKLMGAKLMGAKLMGAKLMDADLMSADLTYVNLTDADLTNTNLIGANLKCAKLWKADLTNAILMDVNLKEVDLSEADLWEANLSGAKYDSKTKFPDGFDKNAHGMKSDDDSESAEKNVR